MKKMNVVLYLMFALLCLPAHAASVDCDEKETTLATCDVSVADAVTALFLNVSDAAFDEGVDGLSKLEREILIRKGESETFQLATRTSTEMVIQNKYALSHRFHVRVYQAQERAVLCVSTSGGQNQMLRCWQGEQQLSLFKAVDIRSFLKDDHGFVVADIVGQYPVQRSFKDAHVQASVNTWGGPLKDSDIAYRLYYVWHGEGKGSFEMKKESLNTNVE